MAKPGTGPEGGSRAWWLALAALAVVGPWPGWAPPWPAVVLVVLGLLALARPRGWAWVSWGAVLLAVVLSPAGRSAQPTTEPGLLRLQLEGHCEGMLGLARDVAEDPALLRVLETTGEALDPGLVFRVLRRRAAGQAGRTVYLGDDRGDLVAWGGAPAAYPPGLRPLGGRRWGMAWWAGSAVLYVREPVMVEGRLVGSVTVADRTPLVGGAVWGMRAPRGCVLRLGGTDGAPATAVSPKNVPAVVVPVRCREDAGCGWPLALVLPWLTLGAAAVALRRRMAWAVVGAGALWCVAAPGHVPAVWLGAWILLAGAAAGRSISLLPSAWARAAVVFGCLATPVLALALFPPPAAAWLPEHVFRPGWGGVWMVALAWVVAGWPGLRRGPGLTLGRRLLVATGIAAVGLAAQAARLPLLLSGAPASRLELQLPRGPVDLRALLPVEPARCNLSDVAPMLARQWGLESWQRPSSLVLVDGEGFEVSRWGDLSPAGDAVRRVRVWHVELAPGNRGWLELWVAAEPWQWLADWRTDRPVDQAHEAPVWSAVFTRSGSVAATVHPGIRKLDAIQAGDLFHSEGGWALLDVDGDRRLARVERREGRERWLVGSVARSPDLGAWVLQVLLACLWALVGITVAVPPSLRRESLETFGGRLRLLVAGGVVLPLVMMTLILHQRLGHEEEQLARVTGLEAARAARWTAGNIQFEGEAGVDLWLLARWLAEQVGGEVVLFRGAEAVASSRPDLVTMGLLPSLPAAAAFPWFQAGRDDPMVVWDDERLIAAAGVEVQGERLLLQLFPRDPIRPGDDPGVVDWLLTGAALAALLALLLTSRVEERVSASLRELVALARRLHRGEPVGQVRRPDERDLAEVIDAVQRMSEEVQQREHSLRAQEELLRRILSTVSSAVLVVRPDGSVPFANPGGEELLEEHRGEVLPRVLALADRYVEGKGPVLESLQPVPGQELTWQIGVARVALADGSAGIVAVISDVTDVVRVDRLRQLTQLARIVAHEVKNPLTPVRLWVQELEAARQRRDPELDALLAEACEEIGLQVERLRELASSFSNLVALERWEAEEVDLAELVEGSVSGLAILERRGVQVRWEAPEAGVCAVIGDRQWLGRALGNLVTNSIEALADAEGEICIRASCDATRVVIEVEDTAGGVPEEQLDQLFNPRFSTTSAGSGLGLALVRQVVTRCGGTVSASNGERGLLVRLELPRASATMSP